MKICETCGKNHNGNYGSGRFCDEKCARSFSTKNKRNDINKKLSQKTKKLWEEGVYDSSRKKGITKIPRKCVGCGDTFNVESWRPTKYCGLECAYQHKERRIKQSETTKQKYREGKLVYGGKTKWFKVETSIGLIKVQGTYEVRTCKLLDKWKDVGKIKNWEYTNDRVSYTDSNGDDKTYLLDFKIFLEDESFYYVEVKGWERENDKFKWDSVIKNGYRLEIWFIEDLKKYEMEFIV